MQAEYQATQKIIPGRSQAFAEAEQCLCRLPQGRQVTVQQGLDDRVDGRPGVRQDGLRARWQDSLLPSRPRQDLRYHPAQAAGQRRIRISGQGELQPARELMQRGRRGAPDQ